MTLEEAKAIWHLQDAPRARPLPDTEALHAIRRQADAFDRKIRRRDRIESWAALFVAVIFGVKSLLLTFNGLYLAGLGAVIVVLGSGWIYWRLNSVRIRHAYEPEALSLADTLRRELDKVNAQIDLLRTVLSWYLLPLGAGQFVMGYALADTTGEVLQIGIFLIVLFGAVYMLNQRAVRNELEPRREELTNLLVDLAREP